MIRRSILALFILASVAAMARQPRFLGPPVKKPADAGPVPADAGAGAAPDAGDSGAAHGQADAAPKEEGADPAGAPCDGKGTR